MFKNKSKSLTNIVVKQIAKNMTNVTGIKLTDDRKNNPWVVTIGSGIIVLLLGIILTPIITPWVISLWKGGNVSDKTQETKLKNVDVSQIAEELNNVKGVDIQRQGGTVEIDGLRVQQQGKKMNNTTGVSLQSGGASGSIVAKETWDIHQQTPAGEVRVQINPTNSPDVHVEFGKVEIKEERDLKQP